LSQPAGTPPFISLETSSPRGFNSVGANNSHLDGNGMMHAFISPSPLQMLPFGSLPNNGASFWTHSMNGMPAYSSSIELDLSDRKKETARGRCTEAKKRKKAESK
jgi:hypothetical protein